MDISDMTSLTQMCAKEQLSLNYMPSVSIKEAGQAFDRLTSRNVFLWNVMIRAYMVKNSYTDQNYCGVSKL